jgi:hypothetical protein
MSMRIELPEFVTPALIERAHRRAQNMLGMGQHGLFRQGIRAARAQDPKLLKVLEYAANHLDHRSEAQAGQTRRAVSANAGDQVQFTEVAMWQSAYEICERPHMTDEDLHPFGWIYAAAAEAAGLTH